MSQLKLFAILLGVVLATVPSAMAQMSGSRGGVANGGVANSLAPLDPDVARTYITIEGQVELRVKPTEIRIVLAVTAEGETPAACAQAVSKSIATLRTQWAGLGIAREDIVEDFISVLPRYDFELTTIRDREVAVEKKVGYHMQTNVHLAVADDASAMKAINIAFANDVSDIIAFDYWSKELDGIKVTARAEALKAAKAKSDVLLGSLFEKQPPVINLQESTKVHYPESLYASFTNTTDAEYEPTYSRRDISLIRTFRPKNTYYRGLYPDGDVQSNELPMRSEISVVSTVRLYYLSPAAHETSAAENNQVAQPTR